MNKDELQEFLFQAVTEEVAGLVDWLATNGTLITHHTLRDQKINHTIQTLVYRIQDKLKEK